MKKRVTFYTGIAIIFSILIWFTVDKGSHLKNNYSNNSSVITNTVHKEVQTKQANSFFEEIKKKFSNPISILLLQLIIIVFFARLLGILFGKIGQPTVIGEIIAGIMLGPSLIGHYCPEFSTFIFPESSMGNLGLLSQVGLVLFMFIIGMELDTKVLRLKVKNALVISHTSIFIAFFSGTILSYFLYNEYAPQGTAFLPFALFIGIALSIAAFPVLARIIQEKGLTKTPLGKTIITIAAVDDLTAWCVLAVIIAVIQAGDLNGAIYSISMALIYIFLMLSLVQPILKRIGNVYISREIIDKKIVALIFILIFASAYFTEVIGIKALFGGFLAGVIMPQNQYLKKAMADKIEDFSLVVLLPLFFVYTGLRTQIGLLNETHYVGVTLMIIGFAITGKFGGSVLASRVMGQTWKESFIIGALMNTRGLMELIVLNIGYDLGILSPEIFTMMVLMTLITTFMTGPVLSFIEFVHTKFLKITNDTKSLTFNIIVSFGVPKMGAALLKLISNFTDNNENKYRITAMHLTPHTEITHTNALKYEAGSFAPIKSIARQLQINLNTIYKTTEDVTKEVIRTVKREKCNFLVIGAAKSIFTNNMLGGRVRTFISQGNCNVGVFIDKDYKDLKKVLIIPDDVSILNMLGIISLLTKNSESNIFLADTIHINEDYPDINSLVEKNKERMEIISPEFNESVLFDQYDLVIISFRFFDKNFKNNPALVESGASLLIVNFTDDRFNEIFSTNQ